MNRQRGQITLLLYAGAALAILAILGGIAYKLRESGKESVRLEWAAANEKQRQAEAAQAATASTTLETENAKAKVVYRTITRDVDKVVTRVEYQRVCFDEPGLRLANAALLGTLAITGKPDEPVPGTDGARQRDGGGGPAKAD